MNDTSRTGSAASASWGAKELEALTNRWRESRRVLLAFGDVVKAPSLLRRLPETSGARFEALSLNEAPVVIGKMGDGLFAFPEDPELSTRHCQVERTPDGRYRMVDLQSTNGIWVNGRKVTERVLVLGDKIRAGNQEFVFHDGSYE